MPGGVPNFTKANDTEIDIAAQERWATNDLEDGQVVSQERFVTAFEIQSDRSTKYAPGYGYKNVQYAEGFADLDMQVADDTAGTNAADATGTFRWEYYSDSDKESLEFASGTFRASNLRAAVAESFRDKIVMNQLSPIVNEDGYLVLAYKGAAAEDGQVLYQGGTSEDQGIPYAKFKL